MRKDIILAAAVLVAAGCASTLLAAPPPLPVALTTAATVDAKRDALYDLLRESSDDALASDYAFLQSAREKQREVLQHGNVAVLPEPLPDLYDDLPALRNALYDLFGQATDEEIDRYYATLQDGRKQIAVLRATWQKHLREQSERSERAVEHR